MKTHHDFAERLNFSEGVEITANILDHIKNAVPSCERIEKANRSQDRNGTDFWARRKHGLPPISIDMKNREFCPIVRFGSDDACIETTSVYLGDAQRPWRDDLRSKPGWTIDDTKRTDLVVYTWPRASSDPNGKLRFWILYFPFLCRASNANWRQWAAKYGEKPAFNDGYLTLSAYVPRVIIAKAIRDITTGTI